MALGGKVTGITSDEIARSKSEIVQHQTETIKALGEFYAATAEADREAADQRIKLACAKGRSARAMAEGLQDIQANAHDQRQQVADWIATIKAASN